MTALVPSDADLIDAARAGDRDAFGVIVARYQRTVVGVVYAMTCDGVLADDVAQEVFVTAYTQLARLHDKARLAAWLCGIARKRALHTLRWRRREVELDDDAVAAAASPFEQLAEHERELIASRALARVPETYRDALVLYYGEDRSASHVARALGISVDAANQRLSRGRACLAADAAVVVERQLAARRPRRDLVAGVVAALVGVRLLGGASSAQAAAVAASPAARMIGWKLALGTAAMAVVTAGVGYLATAAQASTTSEPAAGAPVAAARAPTPTAPAAPAPALAPPPAAPDDTDDAPVDDAALGCDGLGRHWSALVGAAEPDDAYHALRRTDWLASESRQIADHCAAWSAATRRCVAEAASVYDLLLTCPDLGPQPGLRFSLGRHVAAEGGDDLSCAHVSAHVGSLFELDPDRFATVPAKYREQVRIAYAQLRGGEPDRALRECETEGWSETRRRCMLATRADYLVGCAP